MQFLWKYVLAKVLYSPRRGTYKGELIFKVTQGHWCRI